MKGLSAKAIYEEIVIVLAPDAISYSTITNYLHERHFPRLIPNRKLNQY
jgi:hypothetical protein